MFFRKLTALCNRVRHPQLIRQKDPNSAISLLKQRYFLMITLWKTVYLSQIIFPSLSNHPTILDDELLKAIREGTKILNAPMTIITFLQPPMRTAEERTRDEAEFHRIGGKVDRALEKLRRSALKRIEFAQSSISEVVNSAVRELLLQSVSCWRTCLTSPVSSFMHTSHLTYDCIRVYLESEAYNSEGCIDTLTRYIVHSLSNPS